MIKKRLSFSRRGAHDPETSSSRDEMIEWETRPGGMLVQKRVATSETVVPNFLVRVLYGEVRYDISISSQATFGELKKLLTSETGLEPAEQKVVFRKKERQNTEFLDRCGVKSGSKVTLIDDPESKERRVIEMRRNSKIQATRDKIETVSAEVDRLAEQVCVIEKSIANGRKVAEVQITTLIEMLMRQAVKLDCVPLEENHPCASHKKIQGGKIQKCVETLDFLKISNQRIKPVVVTTKWETFDPPRVLTSSTKWEFFD